MKHPHRVTPEEVQASIMKVEYWLMPDGRTTICSLTMDNGFTLLGQSACVDKRNYNEKTGQRHACEDATEKVWAFLGFRAHDRKHQIKLKRNKGVRYRDAASGLYVTKQYAKLNPKTTVSET